MNPQAERVIWALAAVSAAIGIWKAPTAVVDRVSPRPAIASVEHEGLNDEEAFPATGEVPTLFRGDRTPPRVAFDPVAEDSTIGEPEAVVRPQWRLTGVVRGEEWVALLEDASGAERTTRLARVQDRLNRYEILKILSDSVVIGGGDSTWTLRLERPWG